VLTEQRASSTGFSSSAGNNQHVCSSTFWTFESYFYFSLCVFLTCVSVAIGNKLAIN
jgi:hypothetical protein